MTDNYAHLLFFIAQSCCTVPTHSQTNPTKGGLQHCTEENLLNVYKYLKGGESQARDYNGSLFLTLVFVAANNIRIQCSFEVYPSEFQLCQCTEGGKILKR